MHAGDEHGEEGFVEDGADELGDLFRLSIDIRRALESDLCEGKDSSKVFFGLSGLSGRVSGA